MKVKTLIWAVALVAAQSFPVLANSSLSLEQRVQQLELQAETRQKLQIDMSIQLNELQKEVKELRGIVEEQQYLLQQIQDRQRDIYRDIENRFSQVGSNPATANAGKVTTNPNPQTSNVEAAIKPEVNTANDDGRVAYEDAFKLVRNKEYPAAIKAFEAFLLKYPSGPYSDNAVFWIGQVYFAQSQFEQAAQYFERVRSQFPDSAKISSAILKLADIKVKQEQWEPAKALYNEVVEKYTGAPQQLARKGLQDIKQKGH